MLYMEAIGIRLGKLLKQNCLTQKEFAQRCGVSRFTVNATVNGKEKTVTFETLLAFCKALHITLNDFFKDDVFDQDLNFLEKKKGRRIPPSL